MSIPAYVSQTELSEVDPTTNKPREVVPGEPVRASAPNRGNDAVANSVDHVAMLMRAHQSMAPTSTPDLLWVNDARTLSLSADLTLSYTIQDHESVAPITRTTSLRAGNYAFGAGTILALPIGIDASVTGFPNGDVVPPPGELKLFATDGELQLFLREQAALYGSQEALRYFVFARRHGTTLQLFNGLTLRDGIIVQDASRDSGYAGDILSVDLRKLINQDRNLIFTGGGQVSFVLAGINRSVSASLSPLYIRTNEGAVTQVDLTAGVTLTTANNVLAVQMSRSGAFNRSATATNYTTVLNSSNNTLVLGVWDVDSDTFHWVQGSVYRPGDTYPLGMPFALSASYLIEIINQELIYATDAAANTGVPVSSDRLVWVIDGANREVIRPATRESLDNSVTPPSEVFRMFGARVEQIQTSNLFVDVVDPTGATFRGVRAEYVSADQIRARTGSTVNIRDLTGASPANVIGQSFSAALAGGHVTTPELRGIAGSTDTVNVRDIGGADDGILDSKTLKTTLILARGSSGDANIPGATVDMQNGLAPGTSANLMATRLVARSFVRVDGAGVSGPQIRVPGFTTLRVRNEDDMSFRGIAVSSALTGFIRFFDNTLTVGSYWGDLEPVADGVFEFRNSAAVTAGAQVAVGRVKTDILQKLSAGTFINVRDETNSFWRSLTANTYRSVNVTFGPAADPEAPTLQLEADAVETGRLNVTSLAGFAGRDIAARASVFFVNDGGVTPHLRLIVDADTDSRVLALEDPGSVGYHDLRIRHARGRNTARAVQSFRHDGASWVTEGAVLTDDALSGPLIWAITEVDLDTNTPPGAGVPGTINGLQLSGSVHWLDFVSGDYPTNVLHFTAVNTFSSPPQPVQVVARYDSGLTNTLYVQFYTAVGGLMTGAAVRNVRFWVSGFQNGFGTPW